jgi:2-methylcitrate dehydratase
MQLSEAVRADASAGTQGDTMETIATQWADYARSLELGDVPREVLDLAKRLTLDTFACALGALGNETQIALEAAEPELGGAPEATVIGTGRHTSALDAILLNGAMVRFLDANDISLGGHNSEVIPGALAIAEREGRSGADFLASIIIGYELAARFHLGIQAASTAVAGKELESRGFNSDLRAGFVMPAVYGRLMSLERDTIANAIGVSGSRSILLAILDAPKEQNTLAKNLRFPLTAYMALVSTYLAQRGITGPTRVIEGHMGFNETVIDGKMDLTRLVDFTGWHLLESSIKGFSACYATHGHLQATVDLMRESGIAAEDIESIRIVTNSRSLWHTGDAATRRRVSNKETADHSSYYVTAIAILFGAVGPEHYTDELYADPRVHDLMDRVTIEADDERYKAVYPGSRVEVTTKDGVVHVQEALHPRGHYLNPMTDAEVEAKFRAMAAPHLSPRQQDRVIAAVRGIDSAPDVSELTAALVADL